MPLVPATAAKTPDQSPHPVAANQATQKIKATLEDRQALQETLSRVTAEHQIKLAELVKATDSEPAKPFCYEQGNTAGVEQGSSAGAG